MLLIQLFIFLIVECLYALNVNMAIVQRELIDVILENHLKICHKFYYKNLLN